MTDESNVYAPPAADLQPNAAGAPFGSFATFQDAATRAVATIVGLVASPILSALGFALTPRLETDVSGELAAVVVVLGLLMIVVSVGTVVAFCMWFHRVYANLPALGLQSPRFTPGWAVGSFFVPILNLFRPYQAAKEAWNHTEAVLAGDTANFSVARSPGLVALWWTLWLAMNFVSNALLRSSFRQPPGETYRTMEGISLVLDFASAAAAIAVVARLTRMQRAAAARLPA
jgi:hypothetical protein